MTAQAGSGIDIRLQIMGIHRAAEQVHRCILYPGPDSIVKPALNARSYQAGQREIPLDRRISHNTPTRAPGVVSDTECRLIREGRGRSAKQKDTGYKSQDDGRFRFPAHAPHETAIVETVS